MRASVTRVVAPAPVQLGSGHRAGNARMGKWRLGLGFRVTDTYIYFGANGPNLHWLAPLDNVI